MIDINVRECDVSTIIEILGEALRIERDLKDDLQERYNEVAKERTILFRFLKENGYDPSDIIVKQLKSDKEFKDFLDSFEKENK